MLPAQLYLHTSNRVENLAQRLVEVTQEIPLTPTLAQESAMTLNPGIARWLQFEIARLTGVSFGWNFPLPGKLFRQILSGFEPSFAAQGDFQEDKARWLLLELFRNLEDQQRFKLIRDYCGPQASSSRSLGFASKLAKLYDEYLVYRPDVIVEWEDDPESSRYDWQAELWRRLRKELYPNTASPRHIARIWDDLRKGQILDLAINENAWPQRLLVFGVSSLAPLYLDLLSFLANYRPVHIFLLQPSDLYWADLKSKKQIHKITRKAASKRNAAIHASISPEYWLFDTGNPLLPSFGKQGQMFLDLLIDKNPQQDDHAFAEPEANTILSRLQRDLYRIEDARETTDTAPYPNYDESIQIHVCANKRREIETIWDLIVAQMDKNAELHPSDILVMAPDIRMYRSHIEAVFSSKKGTDLEIPFTIADAPSHREGGFFEGLAKIFRNANGRMSANDCLELLQLPILRDAFRFDSIDREHIEQWIRDIGTTWGWDSAHRAEQDAFPTDRNTWKELRHRLVGGMLFSADIALPSGFAVSSGIEGDLADCAGRFIECLELLSDLYERQRQTHALDVWQSLALDLVDRLRKNHPDGDGPAISANETIKEALPSLPNVLASGSDVFRCLADKLESMASAGGYLSGGVTFCSLKPMRAIPANTICLIGMNRLDFPRMARRLNFDLLAREPRIGDRSSREEDRQFFLETILSARNSLYISYLGFLPNSDTRKEPSAVVEELLGYLRHAVGTDCLSRMIHIHRRQSFDPVYFTPQSGLFTFDTIRAEYCNRFNQAASKGTRTSRVPRKKETKPGNPLNEISLEDLIVFYKSPSKYFAQNVAKIRLQSVSDSIPEYDALSLDSLDTYKLRERIAQQLVAGKSLDSLSFEVLNQLKLLPIGHEARSMHALEFEKAKSLLAQFELTGVTSTRARWSFNGLLVTGSTKLQSTSKCQTILYPGEIKEKPLIESWIRHLFATISCPLFRGLTQVLSLHNKSVRKPCSFGRVENPSAIMAELVQGFLKGQNAFFEFHPHLSRLAARDISQSSDEQTTIDVNSLLHELEKHFREAREPSFQSGQSLWSDYDQIAFGSDYSPGKAFLENATSFWEPLESALEPKVSKSKKRNNR